jgi:hypothetical protein
MIFQLANVLAHRSLGDVQLQRCAGEVQVPCGGFKRTQGIERQVHGDPLVFLGSALNYCHWCKPRSGAISSRSFKMMEFQNAKASFPWVWPRWGFSRWRLRSAGAPGTDISKSWSSAMEG